MPYKPMSPKEFEKYLKMVGWYLEKGKIDWNLYNEKAHFICSVKISHGSRTKSEVAASSVKKVKKEFEEKGFVWPPRKKSKKS